MLSKNVADAIITTYNTIFFGKVKAEIVMHLKLSILNKPISRETQLLW